MLRPEGTISFYSLMHCGVYALVRRGEIVYIGKSRKLWIRLYNHCNNRGKVVYLPEGCLRQNKGINFDDIWIWPCMLGQMDSLEVHLIHKYEPRYNVRGKPNPVISIPSEMKELLKHMIVISDLPPPEPMAPRGPYIMRRL